MGGLQRQCRRRGSRRVVFSVFAQFVLADLTGLTLDQVIIGAVAAIAQLQIEACGFNQYCKIMPETNRDRDLRQFDAEDLRAVAPTAEPVHAAVPDRSEEHTNKLKSLIRN